MVLDVCIRGAGIVGRTLALLLARDRLRVGLVRGGPPQGASSDVRAYALNASARDLLEQVRAWPDAQHAAPVAAMEVHGDEGGELRFGAQRLGLDALCWIVDVQGLLARLEEALRFQPLVTWLDAPEPAPLTAVCEGKASSTRAEFGVQFQAQPYPQHAIAARLRCEKPHGNVARQWFANGEIMALLPLADGAGAGSATPDPAAAGRHVALVWSVMAERAPALLAQSPDDFARSVAQASHEALGPLALASERAAWPLQIARADRWCGPGWVLAGDAAHTVHPLAGQGLNLGLADARELARTLHGREYWRSVGDERLLRRYERARKGDVLTMGLATDSLQQLFARTGDPWSAVRNWGMRGFDRSGPLKAWAVRQAMGRL
ncbi:MULTISPECIES: FAD-dependent monooxygenase [Ramlibacter]|uniref:FAD-dependent monooxygenase n=1 Tax=Ramlibacter aquaticus TaxID=2780094 RepID=A0ABR9SAZ6_9BURK|nr:MULTISPECIES: FAD-dependent monooxygenase [Ramlibacter]MBE7939466.1 FAD-dependent monooxygenase [Ramlibacter aquaticus]